MPRIRCVKDVYQIFDDGLHRLSQFTEADPASCLHLAIDMTKVATYSDFKMGVLISEVLEGVFGQIGSLFERYNIPEDEGGDVKAAISQHISSLSSVYKNDTSATCELLADLRFTATQFQFKCYTTWSRTPRRPRMPFGVDV